MKLRDLLAAGTIVLAVSGVFTLPAFDRLGGLSIDVLFWLRHQTFGPRHPPAASPTVVVAIDEETYRTEPFHSLPKVLWTKHLAAVVDATLAAGARVVGFDVIYHNRTIRPLDHGRNSGSNDGAVFRGCGTSPAIRFPSVDRPSDLALRRCTGAATFLL